VLGYMMEHSFKSFLIWLLKPLIIIAKIQNKSKIQNTEAKYKAKAKYKI